MSRSKLRRTRPWLSTVSESGPGLTRHVHGRAAFTTGLPPSAWSELVLRTCPSGRCGHRAGRVDAVVR